MNIAVLHLSDIHIRGKEDPVLSRSAAIASAAYPLLPTTDLFIVLLSGDIAFSGKADQYEAASAFLRSIVDAIKAEREVPVEFVIAPGNHDCDFSGDQSVRGAVLQVLEDQLDDLPDGLVNQCVDVQSAFLAFASSFIRQESMRRNHPLCWSQEFQLGDTSVVCDSINSAWTSTIHERAGQLLYPAKLLADTQAASKGLRFAIMHHPMHWLKQSVYHALRSKLHTVSDLIFTGHEHEGNAGVRTEARDGECAYVEGCVLQQSESAQSEFNLVEIQTQSNSFSCKRFEYVEGRYSAMREGEWLPMRLLPNGISSALTFTPEFMQSLVDPGATLSHPSKPKLTLDDIFVYPDIEPAGDGARQRRSKKFAPKQKSSSVLSSPKTLASNVVLTGTESSGKTRLLYRLMIDYQRQGYFPLLLDGRDIRSSDSGSLSRAVSNAIGAQYGKDRVEQYGQLPAAKKLLLIDNYDHSPLQVEGRRKLQDFIQTGYCSRLFTVADTFELAELVTGELVHAGPGVERYTILPFNHARRAELVKKWTSFGCDETTPRNELLSLCDKAERLIEAAKLQHVATTSPIMVLAILQVGSTPVPKESQQSSFAHYFYFLIVGALGRANVRADEISHYTAIAMHLSWYVRNSGVEGEISAGQFAQFCADYSLEWTSINASDVLATMTKARLLSRRG